MFILFMHTQPTHTQTLQRLCQGSMRLRSLIVMLAKVNKAIVKIQNPHYSMSRRHYEKSHGGSPRNPCDWHLELRTLNPKPSSDGCSTHACLRALCQPPCAAAARRTLRLTLSARSLQASGFGAAYAPKGPCNYMV